MKSWLAQGSSGRRVTLLPGTTFLHINGALLLINCFFFKICIYKIYIGVRTKAYSIFYEILLTSSLSLEKTSELQPVKLGFFQVASMEHSRVALPKMIVRTHEAQSRTMTNGLPFIVVLGTAIRKVPLDEFR